MSCCNVASFISRPARSCLAFLAIGLLGGCSGWSLGGAGATSGPFMEDTVERSTLTLVKAPADAGACIVENARQGGNTAELVPLYGLQSVGVTVKTAPTADAIAVFSLTQRGDGAAVATTTWSGLRERKTMIDALVKGC